MSDAKSFASLTSGLLARKGAARPAMRPQLQSLAFEEQSRVALGGGGGYVQYEPLAQEDLGWNDMGEDFPAESFDSPMETMAPAPPVVPITPDVTPLAAEEASRPEVLRQIESLAGVINRKAEMAARIAAEETVAAPRPSRRKGSALKEGRKAAFTLRLDAERHLRLRLACTLEDRSAQHVVLEALDQFLDAIPGIDDLARRARRN
ncbi:hypothetical protein OLX02_09075 [Novosphingobium sp. KCTC 2891]|uniref:hypothetical protein n=1 Tax=Novosphingobium sp. KCTC 2891 TaxID=2989730 RepID=UPI002223058C|nr:hypothetical protein [Novosphingobium sp. KCTC 2891]MCW1382973.1 hypothetical protein [Novosphingobium sp. KCTC 2891]